MKKTITIVLGLLMAVSVMSVIGTAADMREEMRNWTVYGSVYLNAEGNYLDEDPTYADGNEWDYTIDTNGYINMTGPTGFWWPCALGVKNEAVSLAGLSVEYSSTIPDLGWGGNIAVAILDKKITGPQPYADDQGVLSLFDGTSEEKQANGVQILFRGENEAASTKIGNVEVTVLKGAEEEVKYEAIPVDIAVNIEMKVELVEDAELGYIIKVNGNDIKDKDGKGIDLTSLKSISEGYVAIAANAPGTTLCGLKVMKVKGAAVEEPGASVSSTPETSSTAVSSTAVSSAVENSGCGNKAK